MEDEQKNKRGGGPTTPEGKAVVARNPIKHGVLAQTPVLPLVEREEDVANHDREHAEQIRRTLAV